MIYFVSMSIILYIIIIINKNYMDVNSLKAREILEMTGIFTRFEELLPLKIHASNIR